MNTKTFSLLISTILTIPMAPACGDPCLPTISADTIIMPAADECEAPGTSSGTGDDTTGSSMCEPQPEVDAPVCAGVPGIGDLWGPCIVGGTCTEGFCRETAVGSVCTAECDGCGCEQFACIGGTCLANGECVPSCEYATDDCPLPGMVCDAGVGFCVYPGPTTCDVAAGENGGPCDLTGGCNNNPELTCRSTGAEWICVKSCDEQNPCNPDECMPASPICSESEMCAHPCAGTEDCAVGQTCTPLGCMWPIG